MKNFEIIIFHKKITFLSQNKESPIISTEVFISDLIVLVLRKFKVSKKRSKDFPKSLKFMCKIQVGCFSSADFHYWVS